jgi:hypothetical protein
MTETREPYGRPDLVLEAMEGDNYGLPGALLLGPLGCPECGVAMFDRGDNTLCCINPGCSLYRVPFRRPTVPVERAEALVVDVRADEREKCARYVELQSWIYAEGWPRNPGAVIALRDAARDIRANHLRAARPLEEFQAEMVAEDLLPGEMTSDAETDPDWARTLAAYIGEECRLCGQELTAEDVAEATWAGDRSGQRLCAMAHRRCWNGLVEVAADLGFDARAAVARLYGSPSPQAEGKGATLLDALVENLRLTANTNGREIVERLLQFSDDRHNLFLWEVRTFAKAAIAMLREGAE